MPRFHVLSDLTQDQTILLDQKESRHALRVLRLNEGEVVELFDSSGHTARGIVAGKEGGRLRISIDRSAALPGRGEGNDVRITLAAAVIKPERMELMIQKASELGVHALWPVLTERTVVRLSSERWRSKLERWRKIALESCKQCGRSVIPEIGAVRSLNELLPLLPEFDTVLIPTLAVEGESLYNVLRKNSSSVRILVLIGPEGDFSAKEARSALEAGALPVTLGPLVLRSETAALYALSAAQFYYREVCREEK